MISVVIPTYNNAAIVLRCLAALSIQDYPQDRVEIVVVVDGSRDGTAEALRALQADAPFRLVVEEQENQGPGPARNRGILKASGDVVLIINDDFMAAPDVLRRHADWHAAHPQREYALLGFVEEFAGDGSEFNMSRLDKVFNPLLNLRELGWEHFYTTHISLKRRFFMETNEWFSLDFPYLAYEDVEMGYRLKRHGLRLFLDPGARGVHEHVMGYDQFMRRAYQTGICLVAFWRLHPELKPYLMSKGMIAARPGMNRIRSWVAAAFLNRGTVGLVERAAKALNRAGFNRPAHFLFRRLFGHHQRGGVEEGLRRYVPGEGRWCPL